MKLIDLINKIYKRDIEIGFRFTLKYKEFTLNTYEIRECEYGLMIWDLDNDSRFDSNEYIFDYLDYEIIEIIEEEKEIEKLSIQQVGYQEFDVKRLTEKNRNIRDIVIDFNEQYGKICKKLNELIREVNKLKKEGK